MYDDESRDSAMELASAASYDDLDVRGGYESCSRGVPGVGGAGAGGSGGSPIDGSGSTSGAEESFGIIGSGGGGVGGTMNILGKPIATNNFVTKLYQYVSFFSISLSPAHLFLFFFSSVNFFFPFSFSRSFWFFCSVSFYGPRLFPFDF